MDFLTRKLAGYVLCADNTTLDSGSGGDTIATDDIGGVKYPRSKIIIGADGTNDGDVSATNPLPIKGTGTAGSANAGVLTVQGVAAMTPVQIGDNSGSITVDAPVGTPAFVRLSDGSAAISTLPVSMASAPTGAATSAKQDTEIASLASIDGKITAVNTGAVVISSGTVTANLAAGTNNIGDVDILSIAAGDNNIGNVDIVTVPADPFGVNSDAAATAGSTGSMQAKFRLMTSQLDAIKTALEIIDDADNAASDGLSVSGDVAHDGVDAGEPVKIGAKAIAYGSNPSAVAANDRTNLYANRHGIPFHIGGHPNIITTEFTFTDSDGAQTNAALITVGSGTKIAVTNIAAVCDEANTGGVGVRIGFAAATLSAAATSGVAGILLSHPGIAAGSGYNRGNGDAVIGVGADGEDLRITCEDPAGGSIRVLVSYFTIES